MGSKFVLGLAVIGILVAAVFYKQRGDHIEPAGSILKIRSVPADEQHSIAVLDLRIRNDADVAMNVRDLSTTLELKDGRQMQGTLIGSSDSKQIFQYYPALGELYNEPLLRNSRIAPHQAADFMLAARFDVSEQQLQQRQKLSVLVQDRSMLSFSLLEKRR